MASDVGHTMRCLWVRPDRRGSDLAQGRRTEAPPVPLSGAPTGSLSARWAACERVQARRA